MIDVVGANSPGDDWVGSLHSARVFAEVLVFIVEFTTTTGKVCERYDTYAEACRRVDGFPAESLTTMPMIYQELPDTSQRLIRDDGKPLQWHRYAGLVHEVPEDTVPLSEESLGLFENGWKPLIREPVPFDLDDDEPLPLAE